MDQSNQEVPCTWCVHDVEKVRFASGVGQNHCDGGTLDTNSSLWKNSTKIRSTPQQEKLKKSCNLPSSWTKTLGQVVMQNTVTLKKGYPNF